MKVTFKVLTLQGNEPSVPSVLNEKNIDRTNECHLTAEKRTFEYLT